jgi:hypothetical protein
MAAAHRRHGGGGRGPGRRGHAGRHVVEQRPRRVGADAERRRRAGGGQPRGGLLVAQDQQIRAAHDEAREPPRERGVERPGADADERERLAQGARERSEPRRPGEQRMARPPAGGVQRLEDAAARDDDGVAGGDGAGHGGGVLAVDGAEAVDRGRVGARRRSDDRHVVGQRAGEGAQQRLVAGVALAEGAGEEHPPVGLERRRGHAASS